jgi:hypothetical protein
VSVRAIRRAKGIVWEVRWRDGGRFRSRVFSRKTDAKTFEAEIQRRKQTGDLEIVSAGRTPLAEFAEEWWRHHAPNLERKTQLTNADIYDRHILPRLGDVPLRSISIEVVEQFAFDMRRDGAGDPTIRKVLALLQTILQRAVV